MRKGSQRSGIIWLQFPVFSKLQQVSVYTPWACYEKRRLGFFSRFLTIAWGVLPVIGLQWAHDFSAGYS
jgi:hypothetical protein